MRVRPETQNRLLRRVVAVHDEELKGQPLSKEALALCEEIVSLPNGPSVEPDPKGQLAFQSQTLRRLPSRHVRFRRIVPAILTVVGLVAASSIVSGVLWPDVAAAGIEISTKDGYYIARVTDPEASSAELSAAFEELGLQIELQLIPVSPSLVGTVVAIGEDAGASGIETIRRDDKCVTEGGSCPIGLRIPLDYQGEAELTLGRIAAPSEPFMSAASALAPGEMLHCSGIYGLSVQRALIILDERGITVTFQALVERDGGQFAEETPSASVLGWYVQDALPKAEGQVLIQASRDVPAPLPEPYASRISVGCE